ncbi:NAD(+) diphosphatase [Loktanella sp. SALINAS62]|uniref:NAD(+) diphosphatase n=1 Tax=Loktanella sp. SALINAS62 TaxID=2706124 RepID=UPI001B8D8EEA|nr:NAD(+) diphosphatase [Loktanella sp. SALINAS62]MBS1303072.1 NAD(+) diphosphatase [Loktanella sp. SALINAS62]
MKRAETVTFGGAHLDRAAEWRAQWESHYNDSDVVALWRGKPLIADGALVRLRSDHPVLSDAGPFYLLLARIAGRAVFAADLSGWTPADLDGTHLDSFLDQTEQTHPALTDDARFVELRAAMTVLSRTDAELAAMARSMFAWHGSHGFCANCGAVTTVASAGWQRNCPDCGRHHFPRTDPVVIMLITHGNAVLVGRSPGWPDGMYSLLAGFVEPGETLEAAVRREVFEESGVRVGEVDYLASQPWAFPASLMCGMRGVALTRDIQIDPVEIEDARWVTREEMADVFAGQHSDIKPARPGAIAHFLLESWLADTLD